MTAAIALSSSELPYEQGRQCFEHIVEYPDSGDTCLRALRSGQNFDEYWKFHEVCEYERNHQALYAGGIVPVRIRLPKTTI